ncbi:unnamed protein product [Ambrosiozyma monospora]|uniref:Unnamed protein product n=1 Tax=Ambrosiozyma monospora TaxID=43982 RepID=A0ACB5U4X9_AMBMO|nr:unnamed protein product [Ambrosiozyma monospora]
MDSVGAAMGDEDDLIETEQEKRDGIEGEIYAMQHPEGDVEEELEMRSHSNNPILNLTPKKTGTVSSTVGPVKTLSPSLSSQPVHGTFITARNMLGALKLEEEKGKDQNEGDDHIGVPPPVASTATISIPNATSSGANTVKK